MFLHAITSILIVFSLVNQLVLNKDFSVAAGRLFVKYD